MAAPLVPDQGTEDAQVLTPRLLALHTWSWHHQCCAGVQVDSAGASRTEGYVQMALGVSEEPWPGQWEALSCGVVVAAHPALAGPHLQERGLRLSL